MEFNAAVIGYPVGHSLSPQIHGAVYSAMGFPWSYGLVSAPDEKGVKAVLASARMDAMMAAEPSEAVVGFNVTTPHKILVTQLCDRVGASAEIVGAANTITFMEECDETACRAVLTCDSTDGEGAMRAIERAGHAVAGLPMLVLGTGGAAMSIAFSALMRGASEVMVASRDVEAAAAKLSAMLDRADRLAEGGDLVSWGFASETHEISWTRPGPDRMRAVGYDEVLAAAAGCSVIVNATPVGMSVTDGSPIEGARFSPGQLVMDAVYGHGITRLVADAREAGAYAIDGLGMLVEQALLTIWIWALANYMDFDPDSDAVRKAVDSCGLREAG